MYASPSLIQIKTIFCSIYLFFENASKKQDYILCLFYHGDWNSFKGPIIIWMEEYEAL